MKRITIMAAGLTALMQAPAAHAQGALDMGALTNTLSQDAVTQAVKKRSRTGRHATRPRTKQRSRSTAENCALLPKFKRKYGPGHPDSRRFEAICRSLGY